MTPEEYWALYERSVRPGDPYIATHARRFRQTLAALPKANGPGERAIEVGTYGFFLKALTDVAGYERVDGAIFEEATPYKILRRSFAFDPDQKNYELYNCNLENECLPFSDPVYDLVLAPEILEHMPVDPMGFMMELNRIMKDKARILLTTPNIASNENIFRIMWRQVPNIYHQYRKGRHSDRHNLEYGPDLLMKLMDNSGFAVERIWTEDSWNEQRPEIAKLIADAGYPPELRGDNLFVQAVKVGPIKERFPAFLYD
jgi:SAM-dependent methyltransferase